MKFFAISILFVPACFGMPRERRQAFGGGLDSFGPGFGGDLASLFNASPMMARAGMDSGMFGHAQDQGRGPAFGGGGYGYNSPRGYGDQDMMGGHLNFGGQARSAYAYEPRQRFSPDSGMYEPRQRFGGAGGESMYEPSGRFGAGFGGGDQFIGQDPNIAGGMTGMGMGGMGGFGGGMGGFGGGGMGGDGMEDMVKMQAEMQQMQQQMKHTPASPNLVVTPGKGNTSTNVEKIGDNLLVTNQTRFVDNNDGLTQGFFQEFHIFPGMETTTSGSRDITPEQTTGRPAELGKHNAVVNPTAIFGFTPPDNFFNPRKVAVVPVSDSNSLIGSNEIKPAHPPVKKAFSSEKFEVLGDNFNRAFDSL